MKRPKITQEEIYKFLEGKDPTERIVNLDYQSGDDFITVIFRDEQDRRGRFKDPFYPFLWATKEACLRLAKEGRQVLQDRMKEYGIKCIKLDTNNVEGVPCEAVEDGYTFMFKAKTPMSYSKFLKFFEKAGNPVFSRPKDENDNTQQTNQSSKGQYLVVTPQEQYLIYSGKRFFKGYDDYNDILRMVFDLETEGLDPKKHRIEWFGIRFCRETTYKDKKQDYECELQLKGETKEEKDASELQIINYAFKIITTFWPDVITAHNGENFDWNFIIERCKQLGTCIEEVSSKYFNKEQELDFARKIGVPIADCCNKNIIIDEAFQKRCEKVSPQSKPYECRSRLYKLRTIGKNKKETTLKLGGEVQHFKQTQVPLINITDSLHAVWRAQATDSNFKKADLKYATKYLKMVKPNRVYIPGDKISELSNDYEENYAFNNKNGKWYKITETTPFIAGQDYIKVTGHYIVERYLKDDLWECDKVEYALNSTDFMLCKIVPVPFSKCVTMGTAGQWKAIMLAWSYENGLAIPKPENTGSFTGGLSRLLKVGYVENVIKLDYNSLYPSIILTWAISDETDLMGVMLNMLEYVLTTRETHKALKKKAEKIVNTYEEQINKGIQLTEEEIKEYNTAGNNFKIEDNRQASVKKLGNSFFGSYGSNNGSVFPWKSPKCAERTTCTGRMALRLMISHFHNLGYEPIVGDSFTEDTPIFIKYNKTNLIDIKPISELINEDEIKVDGLGREYDYSRKPYKVLARSGWVEPKYIYRHKTNKDIYEITDGNTRIEVTEDHSLFNSRQEKIKPSEINKETKLEYFTDFKVFNEPKLLTLDVKFPEYYAIELANGKIDRVPSWFLNRPEEAKKFYEIFMKNYRDDISYSKTCLAGLYFIKTCFK